MTTFTLPNLGTDPQPVVTPMETVNTEGLTQDALAEQAAVFKKMGVLTQTATAVQEKQKQENIAIDAEMNVLTSGNFDGKIELNDNALEFDMAGSKSLNAKRQKFLEEYPNGTLTPIALSNGDVKLIYKKEPNDPFRFVNRGVNYPEIARAIASGELIGGV